MTGQKVYYNIGHDDLVSFADRIIRKVKEEERKHQKEAADRLQQMLRLGRVDVKKAIREMRPDGKLDTKADAIREMTAVRQLRRGPRL